MERGGKCVKMNRQYDLLAPQGVGGRNSNNAFILKVLGGEPNTKLDKGPAATYKWILGQLGQYHARKAGQRVGMG